MPKRTRAETAAHLREVVAGWLTHRRYAVFFEVEVYPRQSGLRIKGGRADIVAVNTKGRIIIVELKSGRADFWTDHKVGKWRAYLPYCNQFFFAFPPTMEIPVELKHEKEVGVLQPGRYGWVEAKKRVSRRSMNGKLKKRIILGLLYRTADRNRYHNKRVRWKEDPHEQTRIQPESPW